MNTTKQVRSCVTCKKEVNGRTDKVYCSDKCKNLHHKIARIQTSDINTYNKRVIRNYIILNGLFKADKKEIIIHHNLLFEVGFDKHNFINAIKKSGKIFYSILEFEFEMLEVGMIRIRRKAIKQNYYSEFIRRWEKIFPEGKGLVIDEIEKKIRRKLHYISVEYAKYITVLTFKTKGIT